MTSLLSPFHFGPQRDRHVYFNVRITIHELANVPLVSGHFQAKWRVRNAHGLGTVAAAVVEKGKTRARHAAVGADTAGDGGDSVSSSPRRRVNSHASSLRQGREGYAGSLEEEEEQHRKALPPGSELELSNNSSEPASPKPARRLGLHPSSSGSNDALSMKSGKQAHLDLHTAEPRGETPFTRVKEHTVKWERVIETGVRIGVEKPRVVSAGSAAAAAAAAAAAPSSSSTSPTETRSGDRNASMRHSVSSRSLRERAEKEKEMEAGALSQSELRISVKSDVMTDASHGDSNSNRLGYITLNLSEYAPHPPSSFKSTHAHAHSHHHHHHHHHHQHHHTRTETRRYLLAESKTNATLKVTIEMTHVGGLKEYIVPAIRRGLHVGGLGLAEHIGEHLHYSGSGTVTDSRDVSSVSLPSARAAWAPHSVARHARIPAANLTAALSAKELARNTKEGSSGACETGGGRLAFCFAGAAHHERPPEEVIEAIFNPGPNSNAVLMLPPTVTRSAKVQSSKSDRRAENATITQERRAAPPVTEHRSSFAPASGPENSSQVRGTETAAAALSGPKRRSDDPPVLTPLITGLVSPSVGVLPLQHRRNTSENSFRGILAKAGKSSSSPVTSDERTEQMLRSATASAPAGLTVSRPHSVRWEGDELPSFVAPRIGLTVPSPTERLAGGSTPPAGKGSIAGLLSSSANNSNSSLPLPFAPLPLTPLPPAQEASLATSTPQKRLSKGSIGIPRESATEKGFIGAGWGNLQEDADLPWSSEETCIFTPGTEEGLEWTPIKTGAPLRG